MRPESDEALVARAREGDPRAFEALVARHRDRLVAAARRRIPATIRARVSSSDAVQECLWAARSKLADFEDRGPGSFGRWLAGILDRKVRGHVRDHLLRERRSVRREARRTTRTDAPAPPDRRPSPGTVVQTKEESARVRKALASLPEDQQSMLRLVHEGGMTTSRAAEQLGRSAEAGRKLYARGVAALAKALGKPGGRL